MQEHSYCVCMNNPKMLQLAHNEGCSLLVINYPPVGRVDLGWDPGPKLIITCKNDPQCNK